MTWAAERIAKRACLVLSLFAIAKLLQSIYAP